ncbi:MAG TPA: hypothetical protein VJU86_08785 [Pyrinomonadaceae bacterium]|nr:hypothetical protein [Pyrinomonadaceae bacterium]
MQKLVIAFVLGIVIGAVGGYVVVLSRGTPKPPVNLSKHRCCDSGFQHCVPKTGNCADRNDDKKIEVIDP